MLRFGNCEEQSFDAILEFKWGLTQPQKLTKETGTTQAFIRTTMVISLFNVGSQQYESIFRCLILIHTASYAYESSYKMQLIYNTCNKYLRIHLPATFRTTYVYYYN